MDIVHIGCPNFPDDHSISIEEMICLNCGAECIEVERYE